MEPSTRVSNIRALQDFSECYTVLTRIRIRLISFFRIRKPCRRRAGVLLRKILESPNPRSHNMPNAHSSPKLYVWSVGLFTILFSIVVLWPYYGNNIRSLFDITSYGHDLPLDVSVFVPFSWKLGSYIRIIALMMLVFVPIYNTAFSTLSIWMMIRNRKSLQGFENIILLSIISLSLVLLIASFPDWWRIGYWLAD